MEQALSVSPRKNPPALLAAYAVGFSLMHVVANLQGWYYAYPWFDIPMHLAGGVFVAWVAYAYRDRIRGYAGLSPWVQAAGIVCFAALVGVLWELLEAGADAYRIHTAGMALRDIPDAFGFKPYDVRWDTLLDLLNDLIGAGAVAVVALARGAMRRP